MTSKLSKLIGRVVFPAGPEVPIASRWTRVWRTLVWFCLVFEICQLGKRILLAAFDPDFLEKNYSLPDESQEADSDLSVTETAIQFSLRDHYRAQVPRVQSQSTGAQASPAPHGLISMHCFQRAPAFVCPAPFFCRRSQPLSMQRQSVPWDRTIGAVDVSCAAGRSPLGRSTSDKAFVTASSPQRGAEICSLRANAGGLRSAFGSLRRPASCTASTFPDG